MEDHFVAARQRVQALGDLGVRGRYAPSPTGQLHLGNLRTAIYAWRQVRAHCGRLVLRMEDLDTPRIVGGSAEQILAELRQVGIDWDEGPDIGGPFGPYVQSERTELYASALAYLRNKGLVFPCVCSRKDIAEAVSAPHGHSGFVPYPGTCRPNSRGAQGSAQLPLRPYAWRFIAGQQQIRFTDKVCGAFQQDMARDVGDFVVQRKDGLFAYQLAVVVDDILMGITDIVRGEDLLDSTPRQIALYRALGGHVPRFWHVPLVLDKSGQRMSKRDGSQSLNGLLEQGHDWTSVLEKHPWPTGRQQPDWLLQQT